MLVAATMSTLIGAVIGATSFDRAIGTFFDPNDFAAAIVPALALGLSVSESGSERWQRWAGRIMALVCIWGLVQSESRGGLFAVLVVMVVLLLTSRGRERIGMLLVATIVGAGIALTLLLTPAGGELGKRISSGDSTGRTDLWKVAWYEFEDQPLTGVGLGNYPVRSREYIRPGVQHTELFVSHPRTTHNTFLEVLAELGVFGLIAFSVFVFGALAVLARAFLRARRLPSITAAAYVPVGRGLLAGACGSLATGIFLSGQYQELLWIQLACGIAFAGMVAAASPSGAVGARRRFR
jgi:O-antigen ligase